MGIAITEEHRALADSVRQFVTGRKVLQHARTTLESATDAIPPFWDEAVALGWTGLHLPEEHGGAGFGLPELAVVLHELGRGVAPGPLLPTTLAGAVLARTGGEELRSQLLPALADGTAIGAVGTDGELTWDGDRVSGDAGPVLGGEVAGLLLLPAGDDLVLVEADADGVTVETVDNLDGSRPAARVRCDGVAVPQARVLTGARPVADRLGAALAAAEASGGALALVDTATEYAKTRRQFGRQVGSFQAVKHHLADMLTRAELATAVAWDAARIDPATDEGELAAAIGAAVALDAYTLCARTSIQVHGGIGFTWEHDAHLFLRRATALAGLFGPVDRRREAVTRLTQAGVTRDVSLDLPPEAEQYRREVRDFLARYHATVDEDERARLLADSGYLFPHWPRPWGREAGPVEQLVVDEELSGVQRPESGLASWNLPTIIAFGTEEQQERYVRPALEGRDRWCQLFSEPEAGSDLASLKTRAVKVDGGWRLTGQKIWTSGAMHATKGLALARTDPDAAKHEGIGCFVVDMSAEGVEVRPLRELTGDALFNEVFLDDVFVPDGALVGGATDGWRAARTTLANERVTIGGNRGMGPDVRDVADLAGRRTPDDAGYAREVGALLAENQGMALLGLRTATRALEGAEAGAEGNVSKLLASEHDQRCMELATRIVGTAVAVPDADAQPFVRHYLFTRALSIAGGTSEILRNVIAERLLGLPREPNLT